MFHTAFSKRQLECNWLPGTPMQSEGTAAPGVLVLRNVRHGRFNTKFNNNAADKYISFFTGSFFSEQEGRTDDKRCGTGGYFCEELFG